MNDRLELLHLRYAASLPGKRIELLKVWSAWCEDRDNVGLQREFGTLLHRLSGSAGSYGYVGIGGFAHALDTRLHEWLQRPAGQRDAAAMLLQAMQEDVGGLLAALAQPPTPAG